MTTPPGFKVKATILEVVPDFCWQTAMQVLTMLEQIEPDVNFESVLIQLRQLHKAGLIEIRKGGINPAACGWQ